MRTSRGCCLYRGLASKVAHVYTYVYMCILMACFMGRTDDIRSERVNEEIVLGGKRISIQNTPALCIMYVCSYDLHNVLLDDMHQN